MMGRKVLWESWLSHDGMTGTEAVTNTKSCLLNLLKESVMNKAEYEALPDVTPPANADCLLRAARFERDRETASYKSWSGTDVAEAPLHGMLADTYACIARGKDIEATLTFFGAKWRTYAREQQGRVSAAAKLKHGPSSGASVIHYKWVSEEAWETHARHVRALLTVTHNTKT
jgi:hypothetical protein